jgi:hypothetical protein
MALIIKFARFVAQINDALREASQARQAASQKYPFVPDE